MFTLSYPNFEVGSALSGRLLSAYSELPRAQTDSSLFRLAEAVEAGETSSFLETLKVFFAGIPYDIQLEHEKYYQSVFYLVFSLLGHQVEAESRPADGRMDAVIQTDKAIYVFEFKLYDSKDEALVQIKEKEYHLKYLGAGKPVHLIRVEFDRQKRNIRDWVMETITP